MPTTGKSRIIRDAQGIVQGSVKKGESSYSAPKPKKPKKKKK